MVTVPFENRPEQLAERLYINRFCDEMSGDMIVIPTKSIEKLGIKGGTKYVARKYPGGKWLLVNEIPSDKQVLVAIEKRHCLTLVDGGKNKEKVK